MKKSLLTIMAVLFTAMCMTGCLGDDYESKNYHTLTSTEKSTIINTMAGQYKGIVSAVWGKDTITKDAEFSINNDTTVTIKYPVSILANLIDSKRTELRQALENAEDQYINLNLYMPIAVYNSYWESYWAQAKYIPTLYAKDYTKTFTSGEYTFKFTFDTYLEALNQGTLFNFAYYHSEAEGYLRPIKLE